VYFGGPGADAVADLTLTGAAAGDQFGVSVGGAGDVNGDGSDDVIVGSSFNDAGGADAGRAYVYFGGAFSDTVADLIVTGAAVNDQLGTSVGTAGDVNGDGFADVIVGAPMSDAGGVDAGRGFVYFGGPTPDTTADLVLTGAAAGDFFGTSVGTSGDVNGDAFADVVIGAPNNDAGGVDAGRAYVYYGGPGVNPIADLILTGAAAGDEFGYSVGAAGDVNGDGSSDVIVGARGNDTGGANSGRIYAYFGGSEADATADVEISVARAQDLFGHAVGGAGDVNGDGLGDVIAGANFNDAGGLVSGRAFVFSIYSYVVLSPNGGDLWVGGEPVKVRWLGHDLADLEISFDSGGTWSTLAAGVGGVETNEVTVTAPSVATAFARVRLAYSGEVVTQSTSDASDGVFRIALPEAPPSVAHRLDLQLSGEAAQDRFGNASKGAGDVNGDGFDDVIIGAFGNDAGGAVAGRAYVYYGGPAADTAPDLTLTGAAAGDNFGIAVASAGDMNGDGFADVIVGAIRADAGGVDNGRVYVYYGAPAPDPTADLTFNGQATNDLFGVSVATAGDVNGDGFTDVIVGAYLNDAGGTDSGRAYVYFGGPGADATADLTLTGAAAGENFGFSVATARDVNGDGFAEVIVGAAGSDAGGADAGRAYVYYGGPGADTIADLTLTGAGAGDRFGSSVSTAGDVNSDGFADVVVGARQAGEETAGRAYVYYGSPWADSAADLTFSGLADGDNFGSSVSTAGDLNRDGFDDVIVGAWSSDVHGGNSGAAHVFFGGSGDGVADLVLFGGAAFEAFGFSVSAAGDLNGDSFGDLLIGADQSSVGPGRAYLYDTKRYFLLAPNGGETWNVGSTQTISWLGEETADLWLSVDGGRSYDLLQGGLGRGASFRVPHAPTRFARIKVMAANTALAGGDESDSTFTIQSSINLMRFVVGPPAKDGAEEEGVRLQWETDPPVGPEGILGYRLHRIEPGDETGLGTRIGPELITANEYLDTEGGPRGYRLSAVNGLGEELELGRIAAAAPVSGLRIGPSPIQIGDELAVAFGVPLGSLGLPASDLDVALYDVKGRRVATLGQGQMGGNAGLIELRWRVNSERARLAPGVYFVRASAPSAKFAAERKLVITR
jgi:hypothetical protein